MAAKHIELDLPEGEGSITTMEYLGTDLDADDTQSKRKEVNYASHMQRYEILIKIVSEELEKKKKKSESGTRVFAKVIKHLKEMQNEVPKVAKSMKRKRRVINKKSGFSTACAISPELAKFIGVPPTTLLTRAEISNAICAYVHIKPDETRETVLRWRHLNPDGKRNLQDPNNKTRIIPDKNLSKLLSYEAYKRDVAAGKEKRGMKNKVTKDKEYFVKSDDSLYYNIIQKLIQKHVRKLELPPT